jgi:hypothetical protein
MSKIGFAMKGTTPAHTTSGSSTLKKLDLQTPIAKLIM